MDKVQEMQTNLFIMEVYNNWEFVVDLMRRYRDGGLEGRPVDQMQHDWIVGLTNNGIDVSAFKDADEFYERYIK